MLLLERGGFYLLNELQVFSLVLPKGEKLLAENGSAEEQSRILEEIKSFVLRFKGDEYAVQQMLSYKKKATEALNAFRDSAVKESLLRLLDFAINRVQ